MCKKCFGLLQLWRNLFMANLKLLKHNELKECRLKPIESRKCSQLFLIIFLKLQDVSDPVSSPTMALFVIGGE